MSSPSRAGGKGFTYLGVMFVVAVLALTAAMAGQVWSTLQQRANERELLFVGRQFQAAIERYQQRAKGLDARYPRRLEDLLHDGRTAQIERHLRRLYVDPMTGRPEWGLIRTPDDGIVGVHSLSERKPMPGTLWAAGPEASEVSGAPASYRDWRFIAPSAVSIPTLEPARQAGARATP